MKKTIAFDKPLMKYVAKKTTLEIKGIDWLFTSAENIYTAVKFSIPK